MPEEWKRPTSVTFPTVWRNFEGKKKINGITPKFWIQDLSEEYADAVVDMMCDKFVRDSPLTRYSNLISDPEAVNEFNKKCRYCLKSQMALICLTQSPTSNKKTIIAGINLTTIATKNGKNIEFKTEKMKRINEAVDYVRKLKDAFETFNVNEYLSSMGLLVLPEFRSQNIAYELLKTREVLCKSFGIKLTVSVFSSISSQNIAEKCGFKILSEVKYSDMAKDNNFLTFPGIEQHAKSIKNMYIYYG